MVDDQQEKVVPETASQDGAVPTPEQKTSEPVEAKQVVEETQEAEPATTDKEPELPEGAKERTTQQFDKLKKQLADARERNSRLERTFQPSVNPSKPDWYDPDTGTVDVAKLQQKESSQAQTVANLQHQLQSITKREEIKQEEEAYVSYPELNPKSGNFDESFQKTVISNLATSYAEGKNPTYKEEADRIMKITEKVAKKAEKAGAQKALEQLSPKEQAALEATGRSDRRLPQVDHAALRDTTRKGGRTGLEATMARLSKIPSVG